MTIYSGIWIPLVTPFRDGAPDLDAAQRLVARYARAGCRGVVVAGTTGEGGSLDDAERARLLAAVLEARAPAQSVMMGAGGSDTAQVVADVRRLDAMPHDGWLIPPPYYVRPSQEGIRRHYEAIAAATGHPIALYDIPYRTGVAMSLDTVCRLADDPRFVAIKDSGGGDVARLRALVELTPLAVLAGEDAMIFVAGCLGAHGAIAAAAHLYPERFVALFDALQAGRLADARALDRALAPLVALLFSEPNPAPVKAALALEGRIDEAMRLPMVPVAGATRERLRDALAQTAERLARLP